MAKTPKPEPPKRRNAIARVVTQIPQQMIPNKKKQQKPKHRPDFRKDWGDAFFELLQHQFLKMKEV
ncbi:hypothetical protein [Magnetococcus marinus]|uniref:hypothetical protein n=1 Tax=Magnetococcus marinus TaxID=1124597 RepID=UPI00003C5460|nr:hypothetical protein [Magnetococcus marinus]